MSKKIKNGCLVCALKGIPHRKQVHVEKYFLHYGGDNLKAPVPIKLCKSHGRELFLNGQNKFIFANYYLFRDIIDPDFDRFLDFITDAIFDHKNDYEKFVTTNPKSRVYRL